MKLGIDILGNVAILKFDDKTRAGEKKRIAVGFLKEHKQVSTVLEKTGKFSGRLRTQSTRWLAGDNTKEALYKENGCVFRLNVESCYFSPRLSSERKDIANIVKKGEKVLVMFGGVAPFAIVISKIRKDAEVWSVELGRECSKYALQNVKRNKLEGRVHVVQGDVRRVIQKGGLNFKGNLVPLRFDRIVMARPNLKDSFLDVAFPLIKKSGIIHYYGFYKEDEVDEMKELIIDESKKAGKKIKILRIVKAGDIGPYKFRYRADITSQ
ncbi:hypothetical protein COU60_01825 [Candidatus Pacearchaeota archaeon CG10_big_fil_rev_8_21_14_0_10_34_76]|nr:MAG: hypothetical protein COU60_01825 [Candidatus Pacearchaeota archaeon CG10_big_fil_rev_8_21_14_0_10_34_76]